MYASVVCISLDDGKAQKSAYSVIPPLPLLSRAIDATAVVLSECERLEQETLFSQFNWNALVVFSCNVFCGYTKRCFC